MSSELSQSTASVPSPGEVRTVDVAIVGGGPAGLMAAQQLAEAGVAAHLFDAMPSIGRKFLLAGKGGLNLTHSESADRFAERYGTRRAAIEALLQGLDATGLRAWAQGLGIETFVGSSGRVFPKDMKAAPLLRAWLHRLREAGGRVYVRHRWLGWCEDGALRFAAQQGGFDPLRACVESYAPGGELAVKADAVVLALGGGSWAKLGADGAWVPLLAQRGIGVAPLLPSNCGFDVAGGGGG